MEGSSPRRALSELMRRGTKNMRGADKLAAEANRRRRELLQRNNLDGTLAGDQEAARRGGARRAQGAGPRARRRRQVQRDADRVAAAVAGEGRAGTVRLRLAQRRGAREVRADQGSARPRDARPAVRRHEAGAGERHRRGPSAGQRDARRPQRPAGQARPRRRHRSRISRTSWTSTASSSRRTRATSTSCWTRWPSGPPPRSASATACRPTSVPSWMRWRSRHSARRR